MTGTDSYNTSDLAYVLGEVWSPRINDIFQESLVMANLAWDVSDLVASGARYAHIPSFTTGFSATTQSTPGAEVTLQSPAGSETKLEIDTQKYVAMLIPKHQQTMILNSIDLQAKLVNQASYALAEAFDSSLMSLYSGLSQFVGDGNRTLEDAYIRQAVAKLDSRSVPYNDRAFVFHPDVFHLQIMGISKFYDPNSFVRQKGPVITATLGTTPVLNGQNIAQRGTLYGIDLYTTTNVVSASGVYYNLLIQKDVFVHARPRGGVETISEYKPENIGTLTVSDLIYGVKENRDECGVRILCSTTGVVS